MSDEECSEQRDAQGYYAVAARPRQRECEGCVYANGSDEWQYCHHPATNGGLGRMCSAVIRPDHREIVWVPYEEYVVRRLKGTA